MREISPDELKTQIEGGAAPYILDIREPEKFSDWAIPGAKSLPVIDAMRANDPAPLEAQLEEIPRDQPVVVVCNIGVSAGKATSILEGHGFDVANLAGGMQSWSGVHTLVDVELAGSPSATVLQIRRNGKGCLSYYVESAGYALVIDPSVRSEVYLNLASERGATIVMVLETHVHADHVSRARSLSQAADATLVLPQNDRVTFPYEPIEDRTAIQLGELTLQAVHTPGHTGESTSYQLDERVLFTGDTLFTDAVGRPDLEEGNAGAPAAAEVLFHTLFEVVGELSDRLLVLPCHTGAGIPFDGGVVGAPLGDLRAAIRSYGSDRDGFVRGILGRLGPKPPSFDQVISINEGKSPLVDEAAILQIEAGPNRCAAK